MTDNKIKTYGDFFMNYRNIDTFSAEPLEHYHDSYEIAFYIEADLNIFVRDKNYPISAGDIVFIDEYDIHKVIYSRDMRYTRYVINFRRDFIIDLLKFLRIESVLDSLLKRDYKRVSINLKQKTYLEESFRLLYSTYNETNVKNADIHNAKIINQLILILVKINELFSQKKPAVLPYGKKDYLVQQIISFIDRNYARPINLDLLEKEFYVSKFYLSHVFKELTGFPVVEYILQKRVLEAKKMLRDGNKDIIDISMECGFNNLQHFYRVYKRIMHETPGSTHIRKEKQPD